MDADDTEDLLVSKKWTPMTRIVNWIAARERVRTQQV
jgi:hypothetical protein